MNFSKQEFPRLNEIFNSTDNLVCLIITKMKTLNLISLVKISKSLTTSIYQFYDNFNFSKTSALINEIGREKSIIALFESTTTESKIIKEIIEPNLSKIIPSSGQHKSKSISKLLDPYFSSNLSDLYNIDFDLFHDKETIIYLLYSIFTHFYIFQLEESFLERKFEMKICSLEDICLITNNSLRQLDILEKDDFVGNTVKRDLNSFTLLSYFSKFCLSKEGKALLEMRLREPLKSKERIVSIQKEVQSILENYDEKILFDQLLKSKPNLLKLAKGSFNEMKDKDNFIKLTIQVYFFFKTFLSLEQRNEIQSETLNELKEINRKFEQLFSMLEQTFEMENLENVENIENEELFVRPEFSENLHSLKSQKKEIEERIQLIYEQELYDLLGDSICKLIKLDYSSKETSSKGYFLKITRKNEPKIREYFNRGNLNIIETRKDGVKFTTPEMRKLNETFKELNYEYSREQNIIMDKAIEVIISYKFLFLDAANIFAKIDYLNCLAKVSEQDQFVKPLILDKEEQIIEVKNGRHPLVDSCSSIEFVPNSILLDEKKSLHIITGPNTGGKSTYIKQNCLFVIMAQIGCYVPAEEARVSIRDSIFTRIGANDSQVEGISTFYSEMLETNLLLLKSSKYSMIIIDELGRGTSIAEGFGLAYSICSYIMEDIGALSLFATHFHELNELEKKSDKVIMRKVLSEISEDGIDLKYKIVDGKCESSFGIEIAKLLKFPEEIIKYSENTMKNLEY